MLHLAGEHITAHRWGNVQLIAAPVVSVAIADTADAALFCAVHDVMQSRDVAAAGRCLPVGRTGGARGLGGNCWLATASWPSGL